MRSRTRRIITILVAVLLIATLARNIIRMSHGLSGSVQTPGVVKQGSGQYVGEVNQGNAQIHCALGIPQEQDNAEHFIIRRPQYITSYNNRTHNPDWVSYNLSNWWYGEAPRHKGEFLPDPDLPSPYLRVLHRDYTGSGYDRGHMCRSEERTRNDADNLCTFYTTNLVPQTHELNAGPWLALENYCERLCKRDDKELYVMDGPLYEQDLGSIGRGVQVPSSCYKIVVVLDKGQGLANVQATTPIIAVIMPNTRDIAADPWERYLCTVHDVEQRSGIRFLTALSSDVHDKLAASHYSESASTAGR